MKEIQIKDENAGGRLDKMIFRFIDKAPQSFVYKMLRKKNITLNGKKASGKELLKEGDVIKLFLADETIEKFKSEKPKGPASYNLKPFICYEDDNIIAMNKPAGMLTQKASANDICLNDLLIAYLDSDDEMFVPGVSNRLDRNTSGLVLAGKNLKASRKLNSVIKERAIDKYYLCIVKGVVENVQQIDDWLIKDNEKNIVSISSSETADKKAEHIITEYKPLADNGHATLLEVKLITGKSHQIRAHLAYKGHPIAGDIKYGDKAFNEVVRKEYGVKRQLLHAAKVRLNGFDEGLEYLNKKELYAIIPEDMKLYICTEALDGGCNGYME